MVEAFQLQLQVWSVHQSLVNLGLEVKDVIGDSKIVLKPEGRQQDAVSHGEGEA